MFCSKKKKRERKKERKKEKRDDTATIHSGHLVQLVDRELLRDVGVDVEQAVLVVVLRLGVRVVFRVLRVFMLRVFAFGVSQVGLCVFFVETSAICCCAVPRTTARIKQNKWHMKKKTKTKEEEEEKEEEEVEEDKKHCTALPATQLDQPAPS